MKKVHIAWAVMLFCMMLTGCNNKKDTIDIACSLGYDEMKTQMQKQELTEEAKKAGLELNAVCGDGSIQQQKDDIEALLLQEPRYLIVSPVKTLGLEDTLEKARLQDVKILLYDCSVGSSSFDNYFTIVANDAYENGVLCAEQFGMCLRETEGSILEIQGPSGYSVTKDYAEGFRNELCRYENLSIADVMEGSLERLETRAMVEEYLKHNGNLAGIFAHNDEDGIGAMLALMEQESCVKIPIISIGGKQDVKKGIQGGCYEACVVRDTRLSETAIDMIQRDVEGKTVEKEILFQGTCFDSTNIEVMQGY